MKDLYINSIINEINGFDVKDKKEVIKCINKKIEDYDNDDLEKILSGINNDYVCDYMADIIQELSLDQMKYVLSCIGEKNS